MIDFLNTRIGDVLNRAKLLDESRAWLELFTNNLVLEILREWIQKDQLTQMGVDSDGQNIGYYSKATEIFSEGRKLEGEHYTLDDTGEFYNSMFLTVLANEVLIQADSNKMHDQDWWREEILGLTDENLKKLIEKAKVSYPNYVRRTLGIN